VSGLPYKLVVLWESSVVTSCRKSFAIDLKGSRRVQEGSRKGPVSVLAKPYFDVPSF
jgi:hypothetical protein